MKRKGSRLKAVSFKKLIRLPFFFKRNEIFGHKKMIAPLQSWLLGQKRCVGCGRPLSQMEELRKNGVVLVKCPCLRVFVYDSGNSTYRRALIEEII